MFPNILITFIWHYHQFFSSSVGGKSSKFIIHVIVPSCWSFFIFKSDHCYITSYDCSGAGQKNPKTQCFIVSLIFNYMQLSSDRLQLWTTINIQLVYVCVCIIYERWRVLCRWHRKQRIGEGGKRGMYKNRACSSVHQTTGWKGMNRWRRQRIPLGPARTSLLCNFTSSAAHGVPFSLSFCLFPSLSLSPSRCIKSWARFSLASEVIKSLHN